MPPIRTELKGVSPKSRKYLRHALAEVERSLEHYRFEVAGLVRKYEDMKTLAEFWQAEADKPRSPTVAGLSAEVENYRTLAEFWCAEATKQQPNSQVLFEQRVAKLEKAVESLRAWHTPIAGTRRT